MTYQAWDQVSLAQFSTWGLSFTSPSPVSDHDVYIKEALPYSCSLWEGTSASRKSPNDSPWETLSERQANFCTPLTLVGSLHTPDTGWVPAHP